MKDFLTYAILGGIAYLVLKDRGNTSANAIGVGSTAAATNANTGIMPPDQPAMLRGEFFTTATGDVLDKAITYYGIGKGGGNYDSPPYQVGRPVDEAASPGNSTGAAYVKPDAAFAFGYSMGSGSR